MQETFALGRCTAGWGALQPCTDGAAKSTSPRFFPCALRKTVPRKPPEQWNACNSEGVVRYAVDWAEIEDLFDSKYTHNLTDRHAAAIIKVCHQYLAHYNGIPYIDLPSLTPLVDRLVGGFRRGKSEYGLALRELCNVASKPFVARKVSEPLTHKDAVVQFVVTLCQAAAYEYGDPPAASLGADAAGEAAAALHDVPSQNEAPATAVLEGGIRNQSVDVSSKCDTMVQDSERAHCADEVETPSCSSSLVMPEIVVTKYADVCKKNIQFEKHAEVVERHTPPSEERSSGNVECGSLSPAHTPRTTPGSIHSVGNEIQFPAGTTVNDGNIGGAAAGFAVPPDVCARKGTGTADNVTTDGEQQKEQTGLTVTSQPAGERVSEAKQNEVGAQIEAVRSAVFDFLRALAGQRRTLRHISSRSDAKDCKISSSPTRMNCLAYWPFELPAFLPVLNLVKTAFLHSGTTPVIHISVTRVLLDLSRYKAVASYLIESSLLTGLLREAHFDALAAAGFPSGAAYTEFRGMAIETVLNLAECTIREETSYIARMTDMEASDLVKSLQSLLRQLCAPRSPFQMRHLRNDLLCTLMLLSKHKRLLPFFASSSLLQQIIDKSCELETLSYANDATPDAFSSEVACEMERSPSRVKSWEHSCTSHEASEGEDGLAVDSTQLPTQVMPEDFQDVESLMLCWATIVNCLDDPTCKRIVQNSPFLRTLLDILKAELSWKDVIGKTASRSRVKSTRHRVLFMQAVSLLSPALEHLAETFVDLNGLPLLLHIMEEQLFPNLMDNFLHLLANMCLVSNAAMRARALLLVDSESSAVQSLISCMERSASARAPLWGESPTIGLPAESRSEFLKTQHCATLLLAALCYDSHTACEQFRQLRGPSVLVEQLETTLASMRCLRSWTSVAYIFCLSECMWASITSDGASTKDYIRAGGVRVILEALKKSPKLLQRHLLGCLTELLRDDEAVQECRGWRAAGTGESAMEVLISLWEKDQQKFETSSHDGCIADAWRPLNSQEIKRSSTPSRRMSSTDRFSAPSQSSKCTPLTPRISAHGTLKAESNDSSLAHRCSFQKECPYTGNEGCRGESRMSLRQALLLAASSRRGEEACSQLSNVLERTVFNYECQDIRLDVFCAIESLTRSFCDLQFPLTTQQKQQLELMKVYPRCCQLEMWGDVKFNLQAKGVQPIDVDLHWMETEIQELYSISLRVKDTQQAILQRASSDDTKDVNEFYNQILLKSALRKL